MYYIEYLWILRHNQQRSKIFSTVEQQMINTILSSDKIFLNKEAKSELI